jgi:proton-dependent oligopeptide transporter, POT family
MYALKQSIRICGSLNSARLTGWSPTGQEQLDNDVVAPATEYHKTLFGHPRGLFFLAFTEAWERFSFYGMQALVVLYMVDELLLPGHVEHIAGFSGVRSASEWLTGPLSTQALASQIFGLYAGFVYFTPVFGGFIADRWIGQRNAVVMGALLMSGGHIAMAFDQSFLVALLLLVIGCGFLKGNISTQVGALYPVDDEAQRVRGFTIFSTGINVGAVFGPLVCGVLAQAYGWHYGFGAAGVFMLAGLATYLYGFNELPVRVERRRNEGLRLTMTDRRVIGALLAVIAITVFQSVSYLQIGNVLLVWVQQHVQLAVGRFTVPVAWFESIDSLVSILGVPMLFWLWNWQRLRGREPADIGKLGIGAAIAAASNSILVLGIFVSGGGRISPFWPLLYCAGMGVAFNYYWPTLLALVSSAAPARVNATMMGIAFLSLFVANIVVGWIGGFYERMDPRLFWAMHAAIGGFGLLLVLAVGRRVSRILGVNPQENLALGVTRSSNLESRGIP